MVVTGGSRGLGFATARAFVRRGADVVIVARSAEELHRAERELARERHHVAITGDPSRAHGRIVALACDVTDPRAVTQMVEQVIGELGRIDVLVNCAAEIVVGPLDALTAMDFQSALYRIFFSLYHPAMAVLPHMSENGAGRIVNVTSLGGKVAQPHLGTYIAAKYAATGFSETLAMEARKHGVRVSTVTPPPLRNAAFLNVRIKGDAERELLWFAKSLSSRFFSIDPERAANTIVDAAQYGDAARSVSTLSWLSSRLYALAPGLAVDLMSLWERRALPDTPTPGKTSHARRAKDVAAHTEDPRLKKALERANVAAERYLQPGRN